MNLNNTYRVELHSNKGKKKAILTQYIEADNVDKAISLAKNTFHSRLYGFDVSATSSITQKACGVSKVVEALRFGFSGGWCTIHGNREKTIFDMLDEARTHEYAEGRGEITEITGLYINGERH